jgi:N-methylhydantoinase B
MEVATSDDAPFGISANYDRIDFPARGRDGGGNGQPGALLLASGGKLRGKGQQTVARDDVLRILMPGGGGLGDPLRRDPIRVAEDARLGLISVEAALADYGVVLRDDGSVDEDATRARRRRATGA